MIHTAEQKTDLDVLTTIVDTAAGAMECGQVCVFPASQEQTRYWILDQLEEQIGHRLEESAASNMAIAFRLEGAVEDSLIEPCLRELALRHEALRTTFRMIDGELSQIISEESHFGLSISDLRGLPPVQARDRAEALVHEHSHIHIDLARGPVFFAHLIHVSDRDHILALTLHHVVCDGWSNGILVRDFAQIYCALNEGREPDLPPLPFQFADFTLWQQEWLKGGDAQAALAFWQEHIGRDMPAADLPTDHPRTANKSGPGHIESLLLSPEINAKLRAYSRQHDATMHQVLLAAFQGLISRYTDQTEFLLGSTIANRTQPGMENVVGRFANPQVILADVQGDPSYRELVKRVSEWSARSYAHQDLPFSRLMEAFQLDQSGATSQFLQIYFVYQKAFMQPQQAGALKIVPRPSLSGGVNFDLLVSVVERAEGPRLQIEYNTSLFEKDRIRRLLEMYARVLEAVMTADTLRVSEFPLLAPSEKSSLEFSGISPLPVGCGNHSIPSWFERWTECHGNETAIVSEKQRISWKALHTRSLELACGLAQLGLKAGQTAALCLEPKADAAAAALAVLRLGAVVLPVPEGTTANEWNLILLDLEPALSLGSQASAGKFTTLTSFEKVGKAAAGSSVLPEESPPLSAAQPAWLNVKADSSGHYHVTAVSHQATLQSMLGAASALDMRPGDAVVVWPAQGSAPAWTDLLLPLIARASTVYAHGASPQWLQSLLDTEQAAFAFATPGEFAALIAGGWKGDRRLHLVCRGEGVSAENVKRLAQFPGKIDVLYSAPVTAGPFGVASFQPSEEGTWSGLRLRPLGGQQLMILDRFGSPAPFGVPGELAIRQNAHTGAGVRTGYLARFCPHRGFELIDLADRTVRLHGYRLRLSDLESFLYQNPEIAAAEATLLRGPGNSSILTAYIADGQGKLPNARAASALLKTQAPAHLASAEIIAVDSIARRTDGSPDFSALPRPSVAHSMPAAVEMIAPRDELERRLVTIWEDVLGVQGIGIRNNFFHLGGYSLMIVRLFARINRVLGASLPITSIFNAPTIEQLANVLRGKDVCSRLVPVQTTGALPPFFLIHSYLIYEGLRSALGPNRPFYGLREMEGDEEMTLEERVTAYVREIRSVQPNGPYYLGGWCAAGPLAVETARQLTGLGQSVALIVLFDSWRPGYAAEYSAEQATNPQMTSRAILLRKYRFHRRNLERLPVLDKIKYFTAVGTAKARSSRDRLFLKHWGLAQSLFTKLGMPLPHFMHNVSRKTLESVQQYRGKPFPGRITLIRATQAPYFPQADQACGWNQLAEGGVEVLFAPGSHESMFLEPNLSALGTILDNCLGKKASL